MKKILLLGFGVLLGTGGNLFCTQSMVEKIGVCPNPFYMTIKRVGEQDTFVQSALPFLEKIDSERFIDLRNVENYCAEFNEKKEAKKSSRFAPKPVTPSAPPVRHQGPAHGHHEVKSLDSGVSAPKTTVKVNSSISFETSIPNRKAWNERCAKLALNRHLSKESACPYIDNVGIDLISSGLYPENIIAKDASKEVKELAWQEFERVMNACMQLYKQEILIQSKWLDESMIDLGAYTGQYFKKLILNAGDEVILHGDLHGDISSILQTLDYLEQQGYMHKKSFELVQPNDHQVYMLFLGDYVDRGAYGVETMYTIMRLKLANPDRVFLVRGNHEDAEVSSRYKFRTEANQKLSNCVVDDDNEAFEDITRFYKYLPAAIFVGCAGNFVQCCHGGIPKPGEFELKALIESDKQYAYAKNLDTGNGYMWSDFFEENVEFIPDSPWNRAGYGKLGTQEYLTRNNLKGILRAHQHSPEKNFMMDGLILYKGIFPLWIDKTPSGGTSIDQILASAKHESSGAYKISMRRSLVRTFNVSPDSWVGAGLGYDFDTCGIMQVQKDYTAWYMTTVWNQNPRLAAAAA